MALPVRRVLLAGAAALLAACNTVPPGAPLDSAAAGGEPICREVLEPPSNVPRRYCLTQAQWREYERAGERAADDFMRRLNTSSGVVAQ